MSHILHRLTRQQLRDLATAHNIPRGRDKIETAENIVRFLLRTDNATPKEILTYIAVCL